MLPHPRASSLIFPIVNLLDGVHALLLLVLRLELALHVEVELALALDALLLHVADYALVHGLPKVELR